MLAEINGWDADGQPLSAYTELKDDGSTTLRLLDLLRRLRRRRQPGRAGASPAPSRTGSAPEWGWAWPANRRILYNRASADPDGEPWSERKALRVVGRGGRASGPATTCPTSCADMPPDLPAGRRRRRAPEALAGADPFIMQADGKGWLFAPAGLIDGPLPTHYEPQESPFAQPALRASSATRPARCSRARAQPLPPERRRAAAPTSSRSSLTTYRLTEHFTAGRHEPLDCRTSSELQPEMFCEVSPELAAERGLEHGGWATIVTARSAIEARVLVTERIAPLTRATAGSCTRSACRTTGAPNGLVHRRRRQRARRARARPERAHPGGQGVDRRHPARAAGRAAPRDGSLVEEYRRRAGITDATGTGVMTA